MPDIEEEEEEEAAPEAPLEPPVNEDEKDNLYVQPQARLARRLVLALWTLGLAGLLAGSFCQGWDQNNQLPTWLYMPYQVYFCPTSHARSTSHWCPCPVTFHRSQPGPSSCMCCRASSVQH
jgi:hypothetical protein